MLFYYPAEGQRMWYQEVGQNLLKTWNYYLACCYHRMASLCSLHHFVLLWFGKHTSIHYSHKYLILWSNKFTIELNIDFFLFPFTLKVFWGVSPLQVKVVGPDNSPLANTPVYLSGPGHQNLITDLKGVAKFSFDTASWSGNTAITVWARIGNI